jgi:hypothetical protein
MIVFRYGLSTTVSFHQQDILTWFQQTMCNATLYASDKCIRWHNVYVASRNAATDELLLYVDSVYVETPVDKEFAPIALICSRITVVHYSIGTVKEYSGTCTDINVTRQSIG